MSAGDHTPGRRVSSMETLTNPGDYYLNPHGPALWFRLPRFEECPAEYVARPYFKDAWDQFWQGHCRIDNTWSIHEDMDGTITVSPSILTAIDLGEEPKVHTQWHGYLEHGQWREV